MNKKSPEAALVTQVHGARQLDNLKCWSTKNEMRALYTLTPNASKICYCRFAAAPRVLSWPRRGGGLAAAGKAQEKYGFNVCLSRRCLSCGGHNQYAAGRGSNHLRAQLSGDDSEVVLGQTQSLQLESQGLQVTQTLPDK